MNKPDDRAEHGGYLYDDMTPRERARLQTQLEADPAQAETLRGLRAVRGSLVAWADAPLPAGLHAGVMDQVQLMASQGRKTLGEMIWWLLRREISPAALAIVVAGVALALHLGGAPAGSIDPRVALLVGLMWGGVYNSLFRAALGERGASLAQLRTRAATIDLNMKSVCAWGLMAFLLAFLLAMVTPNPHPFEDRDMFLSIAHKIPYPVAYALPMLFTGFGSLVAGMFGGAFNRAAPVAHGLAVGLVCAILMILDLWTCKWLMPNIPWLMFAFWIVSVVVAGAFHGALGGWLASGLRSRQA